MTIYRQILDISATSSVASDINELHKLVMAGFRPRLDGATTITTPDKHEAGPRAQAKILFATQRQKPGSQKQSWPPHAGSAYKLLVQADTPGDWTGTSYTTDKTLTLATHDAFPVDTTIPAGALVDITGDIHATRRLATPNTGTGTRNNKTARGTRITLTRPQEVGDWLQRAISTHGATAIPDSITVTAPVRLSGLRGPHPLTVDTCHITARVTVHDPDQFTTLLEDGIGRSRSYGLGLIRHHITDE